MSFTPASGDRRTAHQLALEAWERLEAAYRDGDGFRVAWDRLVELFVEAGAKIEGKRPFPEPDFPTYVFHDPTCPRVESAGLPCVCGAVKPR